MIQRIKNQRWIKCKLFAALAVIACIAMGQPIYAQQSIGGGAPRPGAVLDVKSTTTTSFKGGLLIPTGVLHSNTDISVFSNTSVISDGVLYFNQTSSSAMPKGLYYWDSTGVNTGSWKYVSGSNVDSIMSIVKSHSDSLTADKFIKVTGGDSSVLKKVLLSLDVVAIAKDSLFDRTLAHNEYFVKELATDSVFDVTLAKDTLFNHTLAHDTSFVNTLARDTAFINTLTSDSTLITNVRNANVQLHGNMVVVKDRDYTVLDSNYTIVVRQMTANRTLNLPDPKVSAGRILNIVQTLGSYGGKDVVLNFNYAVIYSDAQGGSKNYLDATTYGGNEGSLKIILQSDGTDWYVINTLY